MSRTKKQDEIIEWAILLIQTFVHKNYDYTEEGIMSIAVAIIQKLDANGLTNTKQRDIVDLICNHQHTPEEAIEKAERWTLFRPEDADPQV